MSEITCTNCNKIKCECDDKPTITEKLAAALSSIQQRGSCDNTGKVTTNAADWDKLFDFSLALVECVRQLQHMVDDDIDQPELALERLAEMLK